jgi:hypothetical protein
MAPDPSSSSTPAPDEPPQSRSAGDAPPAPSERAIAISPWELPAVYARLKATMLELEGAWEDGRLAWSLEDRELAGTLGPALLASYRRLVTTRPPDVPHVISFRRDCLHALLNETKHILRTPRRWFPARRAAAAAAPESAGSATSAGDDALPAAHGPPLSHSHPAVIADGPEGACPLRLSQVFAAAFWGIGLELGDPADGDRLAALLVDQTRRRLASDLDALLSIMRWLQRRPNADVGLKIIPDLAGRRFEQLMIDLINEEDDLAHRAPLYEDFLQKTDLRVMLPDLGRPRGARVQVTQTIHVGKLDEKLARIRNLSEFVILSPRSLAQALGEEAGGALLAGPDLDHFWECLESRPASVDELATQLRSVLRGALRHAREDPRGPLAAVPAPVRVLVRTFVEREAYRTTMALRRRELREGKWTETSSKVAILHRRSPWRDAPAEDTP